MRVLIAEDDFIECRILKDIVSEIGECDIVINGHEAVDAFKLACEDKKPYDLICLDIMMPEMDGQSALKGIRDIERKLGIPAEKEVKIIMITALDDPKDIFEAYYKGGATAYIVKPIERHALLDEIHNMGL